MMLRAHMFGGTLRRAPSSRAVWLRAVPLFVSALALAGGSAAPVSAGSAAAPAAPQPRIVGGTTAMITQVPWQVSLWSSGGPEGDFSCGGSIIDATTIVTAAHCVEGAIVGNDPWEDGGLGVIAGVSDVTSELFTDEPQDRVVVDARIHPQWNPSRVQTAGDLAVLELDEPLSLNGITAKAIALPPDAPIGDEPALVGASVRVSGYGRQTSALAPNGALYKLETIIDLPTICGGDDNAVTLCARTPLGAACSGDSGGPLATNTIPPILVGVVSNGPVGCPAGEGESYVNLLAPENRRFLAGSNTPPVAPRLLDEPTFGGAGGLITVGQPVSCAASFTGDAATKWTITNERRAVVATATGGASLTYRPTDADVGHFLSCRVTASNAGGVALAGPIDSDRPVLKPLLAGGPVGAGTPAAPATPFRLKEAVMSATVARTVKRGKVITVKVALTDLFAAAEQATVCVKLGAGKPKCVTPVVKGQPGTSVALRFRISKRARVKSLLTFDVTAALAGQNPTSKLLEQINRSAIARARVSR